MSSIYTLSKEDAESTNKIEQHNLNMKSINDDQQQWTSTFEQLFNSYQRYNELRRKDDAIKERFNDLQTKLQELDVLHPPTDEFYRTTTPSSRDSGVPIRSSSSCCSLTSESTSTPKSSLELPFDQLISQSPQTSVLHFFLHPPINYNNRHVSVHLNEETTDMSYIHDTIPRHQSHGRTVHWNDEQSSLSPQRRSCSQHIFQTENQHYYKSDTNIIKKHGQRISLNASLPYDSKLNIRIHADRTRHDNNNENNINQVKTTATIEPLNDIQHEKEHFDTLRRNYLEHYLTASPNESLITTTTTTSSPIQMRESRRDKLPRHRQVSLPVSLPVDQRLYLYIRNGEVLARC
ncbi:unnamed protein product [Rotaria sp. Silwood2]|nr:unnamed protein product [Rotaria sp. Silwood2]CAF2774527.1 unnamed protein product [Rotaria sp. Silwood2]CAF3157926.1 unnamed protein product [Rotaria sp. Silwood2]CAF4022806.1 unnamed protein product [Rotaria sp. Silwood2]CAF4255518.1 unnamed protein product [Rotaria sp. Silwood2]